MRLTNRLRAAAIMIVLVSSQAYGSELGFYPPTATCPYKPEEQAANRPPARRPYWLKTLILDDGTQMSFANAVTGIWYDDEALHVNPSWPASQDMLDPMVRTSDGRLKRDVERIRIFLQPDRTSPEVYEISVSANCQVRQRRWRNHRVDDSWTAGATARNVNWEASAYSNSIVIPFGSLGGRPKPAASWGFNIVREEATSGEHSNWAGVVGQENLTRQLGVLRFAAPDDPTVVGIWLLSTPLTKGNAFRLSYRFNWPQASAVSRMLVSDGGDVFEPNNSQLIGPAKSVPAWTEHFWTLPKGMPLSVQFVMEKDETVYYATAPIPVKSERADDAARRLGATYDALVTRAANLRNRNARTQFLGTVTPIREQLTATNANLSKILEQPSSGQRSRAIQAEAAPLEKMERRTHLLTGTLASFERIHAQAQVPKFSVGHTHSLVKLRVFESNVNYATPLKLELARQERESGQLVIVPFDRPLRAVTAEWTDLEGPGGSRLPAGDISVDVVGYVHTVAGGYPAPWIGWWPDPLLPLEPTDVPVDRIQPLWVTVFARPGTEAGLYRGTITITTANAGSLQVPLEVEVWDYDLPLRGKFKTAIGMRFFRDLTPWYGFDKVNDSFSTFSSPQPIPRAFRLKMYDFFLKHRVNPCSLFQSRTMPDKEDVAYCVERGMNALVLLVPPGEVDDKVIKHVEGWRDFLASKGWLDMLYIFGFDEIESRPNVIPDMLRQRPQLKAHFPEIPIACTINHPHPQWDSFIDIWIPTTSSYNHAEWVEQRRKTDDQVWWYTACEVPPFTGVLMDVPAIKHRILFWQNFKYRVPGYLYYLATGWAGNPSNPNQPRWPQIPWVPNTVCGTHNGCGYLTYPGKDGLLASIRLAVIRDGIEDYEAFAVLEELTDELKQSGKGRKLVETNQEVLQVSPQVTEDLRHYTDDPLVLLEQRTLLAKQIVRTRQALGK